MRKTFHWGLISVFIALAAVACGSAVGNNNPGENPKLEATPDNAPLFSFEDTPAVDVKGQPGTLMPEDLPAGESIQSAVRVSDLLGYAVAGPDGPLGQVTGIVLDGLIGQANYLAVQTAGTQGDHEILLPWQRFQIVTQAPSEDRQESEPAPVVYVPTDEGMASAPDFDRSMLAGSLKKGWDEGIRAHWAGLDASLPATGAAGLALEGTLWFDSTVRIEFQNSQGETIGTVEDLIVMQDGVLAFALLRPAPELNLGEDLIPVPWKTASWLPEQQILMLNVGQGVLQEAPRFDMAQPPDMTVPGWEGDWSTFWNNQLASQEDPQITPTGPVENQPILTSSLFEQPVVDPNGTAVGLIEDWLIDYLGNSEYIIIRQNAQAVLVPWVTLIWNAEQGRYHLDVAREVVDHAPSYQAGNEAAGLKAARAYWRQYLAQIEPEGDQPGVGEMDPLVLLASRLVSSPVTSPETPEMGTVADLVMTPRAQVVYVIVKSGDRYRPVPWSTFEPQDESHTLLYIDDPARFEAAPGFASPGEIPLAQPDWDHEIRAHWGMK